MHEKFEKKWTKYFVNDIECERDAIYQTILENKLYDSTITLIKKYHFELSEKSRVEESNGYRSNKKISTSSQSENKSAYISHETKVFADKMGYASKEYNQLIDKLIHAVDMLFETEKNYDLYSQQFRAAMRDFLSFLYKYTVENDTAYNDFLRKLSLEYAIFLFDMIAFSLSEGYCSNQKKLPSLVFDFSDLKIKWNENWDNKSKEEFLNKFLSILLQQTEIVLSQWQKSDAFNESAKQQITASFNEFKEVIKDFQTQKRMLDKLLFPEIQKTIVFDNMFAFYQQPQVKLRIDEQEKSRLLGPQ
ncbi:hypothetical protein [Legionella longbeachae]|uniref:Uncharacterized protein n=1 Tax=Legionella longbeachae serogroup 1 (strain NSW150) TaxID=661367 RepID=D3HQ28_LEGLN|nr:hypothetical protein [Legionella longbeachae]VEE01513.1 Uncharacterised protein [Legionella oakridgensis]HBD7396276.1 hypothetical protein [Legionella pneumophila]ARB92132.1 hypothetical protein A6J40_08050 [Legionella longbeachae]ARM34689.1 hypothetical protein B0B39_14670 [Legionella longbeachae]EEZ95903.1 hypothetical protein LLB_1086 [Legionella longbeachae D-4968]